MSSTPEKEIFDVLNQYFDKIYIITLERSNERHEFIRKSLPELNYEFHWGTDGKEFSIDTFIDKGLYNSHLSKQLRILNDQASNDMLVNAVACALSHTGIHKKMLDNGYKKVLVLEDDIVIGKNSNPIQLQKGFDELPGDWDLLYLGHLDNNMIRKLSTKIRIKLLYPILYSLGYKRYNPEYLHRRYPRSFSDQLNRAGYHYGTHAYAISETGAKKLLRYQTPVTREIDIAAAELSMLNFLNSFSLKNRIFFQNRENLPSMIEEDLFKK